MDQEQGEAELVLDPTEVADVQRWAAEEGLEVVSVEQQGFEPITTVTLLIFGGIAGVALVKHLLDQRRGGQVIDLRGGEPAFRRDPELIYGLVVILVADGTVTVDVKEPKGILGEIIEALRSTITDLGKAGIETIAAAARTAVGARGSVTTS
ncbi:hypothetical protein [Cellulomonas rhizosphaerae]|uniref:Uncharacterized protein n=1 Tax=Cellulomonas rhizosphaerae TaxID=2293719 RepID=A0A413RIM5_9CELL|nr:hypothetical protein [Cellulomonas rhizosphaerae]RHA38186.1 hypothetical protein D1825_14900 [Cellulomonas rhizosphaerae]